MPIVCLAELLELTILIAEREPHRHVRLSARWLFRYLEVRDQATIDDAALVTACPVVADSVGRPLRV